MKKILLSFLFSSITLIVLSQDSYKDSMNKYIADYIKNHEVVTGDNKKKMSFYPVDEKFRVKARFEKVDDGKWFNMETSGGTRDVNRVYGIIHFTVNETPVKLHIYQSKDLLNITQYKDYLFLPFTDLSSGEETYESGRYIDLKLADITGSSVIIDFNKAYNPYCAYVSGKYNCPIPPKENHLNVTIAAGEKKYSK
jgi:uncharacterized protein